MTTFWHDTVSMGDPSTESAHSPLTLKTQCRVALLQWLASGLVVLLAVKLASRYVPLCAEHPYAQRTSTLADMAAWDGRWYRQIVTEGYAYGPHATSSIAFFPAYPLVARLLSSGTGLPAELALLVVSNGCFLCALVVAVLYMHERAPTQPATVAICSTSALVWFPTTFYFRMAYSESLLLLLSMLAMYGIRRRWPPWVLALIVSAGTATRPVGVALLVPLSMHLWSSAWRRPSRLPQAAQPHATCAATIRGCIVRVLTAMPVLLLACWGLLVFMAYQEWAFGDPFTFVKAQGLWDTTLHRDYAWERMARLLTFEPIRAVYDPSSSFYWALHPPRNYAALNMMFANPLYFGLAVCTIVFGAAKRWLAKDEVALGMLMLLIPYALRADQTCMASQARFASIAFPVYIVWGRLLSGCPLLARWSLGAVSSVMLAVYSSLFVSWYWYY